MLQRIVRAMICLGLACQASALQAVIRSWDGEGGDGLWSNPLNWSLDGTPQTSDDIRIGNLPAAANDTTIYDLPGQTIQSLSLSNGADVDTNGLELLVNDATTLSDAVSSLIIRTNSTDADFDSFDTNTLTINSGAMVTMDGGVLEVDAGLLEINSGGTISGRGRVDLEFNSGGTRVLENSGAIRVTKPALEPNATLSIRATGNGTIDLDGDSEAASVVDVDDGTGIFTGPLTLIIDGPLDDGFSGAMDIGRGDTVNFLQPWSISMGVAGGGINFNGVDGAATLTGAPLSGPGFLNVNSGTGVLENDLTLTSGNLVVAADATVQFDGTASISHDVAVQFEDSASLVVNGTVAFGSLTNRMLAFDWDGIGDATTTVNAGATLILNAGNLDAADDTFDGSLHINSGDTSVTVADGTWVMDNFLTMTNTAANVPDLSGSALEIGNDSGLLDADLNVGGAGESRIHAHVTFYSDADVNVAAGATLTIAGNATFNSGSNSNEFTGAGALRLAGANTVNEPTTINMTGGTVELDNSDVFALVANNTTVNAPLTINAATMAEYGSSKTFISTTFSELSIDSSGANTGSLTVNLDDPNAEWTVNSLGILSLHGDVVPTTLLAGSDVNLNGTVNTFGDVRVDARVDIAGTVNINALTLDGFDYLRLSGGNTTTDPNTIVGGTINSDLLSGTKRLGADDGSALHGFGTINTDVDFDGNADLLANDGTLTVNGSILDARYVGTADADGVLNLVNDFDTNVVTEVRLNGGELTGAGDIDNAGGVIRGFGRITSYVDNGGQIIADGGTLELARVNLDGFQSDPNDGDGSATAVDGNILVSDTVDELDSFVGTLNIGAGRSFTYDSGGTNDLIRFDDPTGDSDANGDFGRLNFTGGTLIADDVRLQGQLTANTSTARITAGNIEFDALGANTINADLEVDGDSVVVAGATFSGAGSLVNLAGRTMILTDGADVGVVLENDGALALGVSPGQVQGTSFQQDATGTLQIELMGAGLDDFDSMDLTGQAQLAGTLDLTLLGGFSPGLGDAFKIILADGGVTGSFTSVHQPAGMPAGLIFDVIYTPTQVQLQVVNCPIFSADFDCDGDVDGDDLAQWRADFGINDKSDADNDGDSDGADFLAWQRQLGSVPAISATNAVPEPSAAVLTTLALMAALRGALGRAD